MDGYWKCGFGYDKRKRATICYKMLHWFSMDTVQCDTKEGVYYESDKTNQKPTGAAEIQRLLSTHTIPSAKLYTAGAGIKYCP